MPVRHVLYVRKDTVVHELSSRWKINYNVHIVRKSDYKGAVVADHDKKLQLPFNGCTMPGFFLIASCTGLACYIVLLLRSSALFETCSYTEVASVLQIRSCRPELQKAACSALEIMIANMTPCDMTIPLLPNVEVCFLSECYSDS